VFVDVAIGTALATWELAQAGQPVEAIAPATSPAGAVQMAMALATANLGRE
jgi:predicted nucleic acid-binding Zn ribbon protein